MTDIEIRKYNKLKEISEPFEALLFDVDGTLADNMHAHKSAYAAAAAEYNIDLDPTIIDETAGWPTVAVAEEISKRYNTPLDKDVFAKRKSAIFVERYVQDTLPIEYVRKVLFENVGKKKIGIVSGGSRSTLAITLNVIEVEGKFESLVCAGDTPQGKPSPQPFEKCAQELDVEPSRCLVFEDGDPGVRGAISAGMSWVRIDQL